MKNLLSHILILIPSFAYFINERYSPDPYEVNFNGSALSSGVYYYVLRCNNYSELKKLVIIK